MAEMMSFEVLPAMGVSPEVVVLASAFCATASLALNLLGGVVKESKRAEMQLELERGKLSLQQLATIRDVTARYRGPLLESAIDLEQRLWHLITEWPLQRRSSDEALEEVRYFVYCLSQFLGFVEVVRREAPREQAFLQAGNPQGSDTMLTLVEGIRFVLCASQSSLDKWYGAGRNRPHPGNRVRDSRDEVIKARASGQAPLPSRFDPGVGIMHVSRGQQRGIGSLMVTTPMGAKRHYSLAYSDFYDRWECDPNFRRWFTQVGTQLESDALDLATGRPWHGEGPFPTGRWTRVLLLQQLLVDVMDLLDPDCVRLPLARRTRLMPIKYGPLPSIEQYQQQLKDLSRAWDSQEDGGDGPGAALEGIAALLVSRSWDAENPAEELRSGNGAASGAANGTANGQYTGTRSVSPGMNGVSSSNGSRPSPPPAPRGREPLNSRR